MPVSETLPKEVNGQVRRLLQHTFGSACEPAEMRVGNRRHDYLVLLARLRHPDLEVAIKLAGPEAPYVYPFDRTAMLHRLVAARTSIPMPDILAVDVSYERWPWRVLIKTYIPGEPWYAVHPRLAADELRAAYEQIGRAAAEIHSIGFPHFGELRADGRVDGNATVFLPVLAARARQIIRSARLSDLFVSLLEERGELFADVGTPGLCHEDLHGYNILFRAQEGQCRLATILDFDKGWAGHPETDLARLELWTGMVGDGFWPAYRAVRPVADGYAERRPIYQLLWCLEYAQNTPRHLADTAHLCQELGLPAIERFDPEG
jgi:Ser/Thr protein kinase RdoA (MazF antagonist)